MGFFDRFRKKKEPEMPYAPGEAGEEIKPAQPSTPEDEDPFSERAVAKLEEEGFTINWRYGYRLANRYEVKRVCAGGQGVVFIVEDLMENDKRYAAKTLKAYFRKPEAEDEWERWRDSANDYLRECNIWVDLGKHRHIVQAEYLDKIDGVPLVMSEFIDGGSLDAWLKKGPLEMTTALDWAIQACIGMEYANKKGVAVHRDIKPGNILVTREGVAKINDFGIAKAVESAETIRLEAEPYAALGGASLLVSRGMGTPPYMAPEQFHRPLLSLVGYPAMPLGVEADIYAFGLVLYEMLTGKLAIQIESDREMEIQREVQRIVSIPGVNPGYGLNDWATIVYCFLKTLKTFPPRPSRNEHLNAVILKCLAKEPGKRYHSFTELKTELTQIYHEETGREFQLIEEPIYESNWRKKGKTYWVLGREKDSLNCYDRALGQDPDDVLAWLEKGLASAEAGDLTEFGLSMEIIAYLKPSWGGEIGQYKESILNGHNVQPGDTKLLDRLALECAVPEQLRGWVWSGARQEYADPFREPNPLKSKLLDQLKVGDASMRREAATALGQLRDRSAVPALIEALKDEDELVRGNAATALGFLGDRSAALALTEALKDKELSVRCVIARALSKLGDRSAVLALTEALKDERNEYKRTICAKILSLDSEMSTLGEKIAERELERLMTGEKTRKLEDRSQVPGLIERLKDEGYWVRSWAAELLGESGDRSAVPALIEALKDEDDSVRFEAAEALGKLADKQTICRLLEASTSFPDPSAVLVALRWACSRPDEVKLTQTKYKLQPYSAFEWTKRGAELTVQSEFGKALECFEKAIETDPDWELPKKARDECLKNVDKGMVQPAVGELEEAVPASIETQKVKLEGVECVDWLRKGTALFNLGKYAEAMECYDKALEMDSGSSDAWYCKGITLNRLSRYEEAVESFDRAVKINPRDKLSWYNMGYALTKLGRHEEAKQCFDRALEVDPRDADAWYSKGHNLAMLSRHEEAIQCYDMALEINPRYAYAWAGKGVILHQMGKRKEAMKCFRKALEIDSSLRENLGDLLTEK